MGEMCVEGMSMYVQQAAGFMNVEPRRGVWVETVI